MTRVAGAKNFGSASTRAGASDRLVSLFALGVFLVDPLQSADQVGHAGPIMAIIVSRC
jgi:hypothetical protein